MRVGAGTLLKCSVAGCENRAVARTLCRNHYSKAWMQNALPRRPPTPRKVYIKAFIPGELAAKLNKASRQTGKSASQIVRELLEGALG